MSNHWFWKRDLDELVLPLLKRLYEFHVQHVITGVQRLIDEMPNEIDQRYREAGGYADESAGASMWEDVIEEQLEWRDALGVYTCALCEAMYLEASKFLLLFYRKEILSPAEESISKPPRHLGDLTNLFAANGLVLRKLPGFEAYNLLRLIANCHKHMHGTSCDELRRERPDWLRAHPVGWEVIRIEPSEVKTLYEGLCSFLRNVVEALHIQREVGGE